MRWAPLAFIILGLAVVASFAFFWSGAAPDPVPPARVSTSQESSEFRKVELKPPDDSSVQRFSDIAANPFSTEFAKSFRYEPPSLGVVRYREKAGTFTGFLTVRNLKPNFAYQVKLVGTPSDVASMENLGFNGRWLLPSGGTNFSDEDYLALEDKSGVEGYIFFDWFVTDKRGDAELQFSLDTCLHVLMSKTLEGAQPPSPELLRTFRVDSFLPFAYDKEYDPLDVEIWAMSEYYWSQERPEPGLTRLPASRYNCLFRLTEECFHGVGGGMWATALEAPVSFEVTN
ncbi:MAG: hypothetical protein U5N86_02160 [Planctomycetota bacterium]|nr:hypothetical protein [Planctomycetota bacterium]